MRSNRMLARAGNLLARAGMLAVSLKCPGHDAATSRPQNHLDRGLHAPRARAAALGATVVRTGEPVELQIPRALRRPGWRGSAPIPATPPSEPRRAARRAHVPPCERGDGARRLQRSEPLRAGLPPRAWRAPQFVPPRRTRNADAGTNRPIGESAHAQS